MKTRTARSFAAQFVAIPPLTPIALAVALALSAPHALHAAPVGATVVAGQAQLTQPDAHTMLVTQGTDKAIINWRSFSIAAGETVRFQQPNSASVALNRVTTATPSEIFGSLSANGKVFLVNASGVMFGRNASVDVGGLVASTLNIADNDFLAGRYTFADSGGNAGAVRNEGSLAAAARGTIALLGAQVSNSGTITARLGTVGLAAGGKVSLDFNGDGLTRIVVDAARINALVENGGAVIADGGQVTMTARALDALADSVVRQNGVVRANALVERNGRIFLDGGSAGKVEVGGTLEATGLAAGQHGGEVTLLGHDLALAATARIDVRGDSGGGVVLAGGDYQGANALSVPHAASTSMAAGASIRADAIGNGDGGKIILWSDGPTSVHGTASAKGGPRGGDGGMVETSGRTVEDAGMRVNASSALGKAGTWLVDPEDRTVDATLADSIAATLDNGTNYTLRTNEHEFEQSGDINVNASIVKTAGPDVKLTFEADRDIIVAPGVRIASTAPNGKLDVDLNANARGIWNANEYNGLSGIGAIALGSGAAIITNGGSIRLYGQSDPDHGYAVGNTVHHEGILLDSVTLDTRVANSNTGGNIWMRSIGDMQGIVGGTGILLSEPQISSGTGDITMFAYGGKGVHPSGGKPTGGIGIAIEAAGSAQVSSTSGAVSIWGRDGSAWDFDQSSLQSDGSFGLRARLGADGTISSTDGNITLFGESYGTRGLGTFAQNGNISTASGYQIVMGSSYQTAGLGLELDGTSLIATAGGTIDFRGLSTNTSGIVMNFVRATTTGSPGAILITAETKAESEAMYVRDFKIGSDQMSGDVVIRAANAPAPSAHIGLISHPVEDTSEIRTSGMVALRPGGIDPNSNVREDTATAISVGDGPAPFLVGLDVFGLGASSFTRLVIGSRQHTGHIDFTLPAQFNGDLTLQNDGAGSAGINLYGSIDVTGLLTLSSGGSVEGRSSAISASKLLLHGAQPEANFQLTNDANNVRTFAALFDTAKGLASPDYGDVNFTNTGSLRIGTLSGTGFSTASNGPTVISATETVVAGDLLVRTSGDLTLGHNVTTLGSDITLATGGVFLNAGGNTLTPGGGDTWRVFADTWVGEVRGGLVPSQPHPNYYNCAYGDGCSAAITGNRFIYRQQPTLVLAGDALGREYGDPNPALTFMPLGLVNGDTLADVVSGGGATTATQSSQVGTYAVNPNFVSEVGYLLDMRPGALTINPAPLLVAVNDKSKVYGAADPLLTANISGFKLSETDAVVSGLTLTTATGAAATAGSHAIVGANASATNYTFNYQPGTLAVAAAPLVVTADDKSKRYGDAEPLLTASMNGLQYADASSVVSGLALSTATGAAATAGLHPIVASDATAANYSISYVPGTLDVDKAALLVIADDKSKIYGDPDPLPTAQFSGFKYADSPVAVTGLTLSAPTGAAAGAGSHAIVAANGAADNYTLSYQSGTLSVAKAALQVIADDKAKVYGGPDPLLTATLRGFRYADTAAAVSAVTLSAPTGAAATAGTHPILAANGASSNYTFNYQPGILSVGKAPLVVAADNKGKVYGAADPLLTSTVSGLMYSDTVAGIGVALSTATGAAATAGSHSIVAAAGDTANYTVNAVSGTLSVDTAPLLVAADDKAKVYGAADPLLTATMTGLQYADTNAVVSGLTLSAPTGAGAGAGSHPIVAANGAAANYALSYQPGTLSVDKAPLLVVADNKAKVYGAAEPLLTATMSGFKYADTGAVVSGLTLSAATGAAAGAGSHPIIASSGQASNYALSYVPGVLAVAPAVLTYVAEATTQVQGEPAVHINGSVSGFVYGDTQATATTGTLAFSALGTAQASPGVYAVQGRGLAAVNYQFIQAQANEFALHTVAMAATYRPPVTADVTFESSNVYAKNFGTPRLCVGTGPLGSGSVAGEGNDMLALEWSRVRVSPNLSNCLGLGQRNSCSDF